MRNQQAKSLVSLNEEKLIGNSGCKLNIFKDKVFKVRKESSNFLNSNRLNRQYLKILSFKNFNNISVPKIYTFNKSRNLFYYDMEYINGPTLSLYLMSQPISETKVVIDNIIEFIFNCKKNSNSKYNQSKFFDKIEDLQKNIIFKENFFKKIFKILKKHNWKNVEKSSSHGDLSLENIIIKNENIKFIDLSDNFISSYKLDISKIIFDVISSWSFRNTPLKSDDLKIYSLKIYLLKIFSKKLSSNDIEDIKMLIILDFLRVLIYTKNKDEINLLENKLKNFYDNINNPLRW
jgi:tRNA A-37 threonylcarbamoyl transferase component Bud32